jgi:hypothetical protein
MAFRWRSTSRQPACMGLGNAVRRYTKGIVPVLRQLASRGFKGSALGDLSYRGKRLAKAGQKLGITIKAIARGRDGVFLPTGICWGGALLFLVEPLSPVEYDLRADQGAPRRLRRDCLYFNGLITNDKFCLSRSGRLVLNWWRLPLRLRDRAREGAGTVPDQESDRGGAHEALLAGPPADAADHGRSLAVGSGVHAHPALEPIRQPVGSGHGERHLPTNTGGER